MGGQDGSWRGPANAHIVLGEIYELRGELNSDLQIVRKEAVKKVIASMTIGKDVGSLFPDVLKNVHTEDIELKKLVYLYLMNYAKSQPELVILAINTFCKDTEDPNPLVRALAIRTMGCLRVDKVLDYLCEPLCRSLKDENAYVRKTAAICAAKVCELAPELAEENGFVETLREMLQDSNPTVLANVVAALSDVQAHRPELGALEIDSRLAARLASVLNDCTEWGQVVILDALVQYQPGGATEAAQYIERILPRLQHANSSVVLSAVKLILVYWELLPAGHDLDDLLYRKLAPPLVSMLSSPPEVQYVVLRNISLILRRRRAILAQGVRVFFCKFNDPLYIKLEKLEIIELLADEDNCEQVLGELKEYAREVDLDFARKAVQSMAHCAIRIPLAAPRTFALLEELATTALSQATTSVRGAVAVAAQCLLRKYPSDGGAHGLVTALLADVEAFDEEDAKVAIIWIISRYGHPLLGGAAQSPADLLQPLVDNFGLEPVLVQAELLSGALRLFFLAPAQYRPLLVQVINRGLATPDCADVRERCIIYGRLLEADPALLESLLPERLALSPPQSEASISGDTLEALLPHLCSLASVYHRLPAGEETAINGISVKAPPPLPDLLNLDDDEAVVVSPTPSEHSSPTAHSPTTPSAGGNMVDLLAD